MSDEVINIPAAGAKRPVLDESSKKITVLDQLREVISQEVTRPDIEIAVPERPGVTVTFSPNISNDQLKAWRRSSTNKRTDEMDSIKFSCYVIGQTVTGIYIHGKLAMDDDGNVITFASPEMLEMTGKDRPLPDAIQAFYGVDPHLEAVALKVLDYAGYGDDVEMGDPTKG